MYLLRHKLFYVGVGSCCLLLVSHQFIYFTTQHLLVSGVLLLASAVFEVYGKSRFWADRCCQIAYQLTLFVSLLVNAYILMNPCAIQTVLYEHYDWAVILTGHALTHMLLPILIILSARGGPIQPQLRLDNRIIALLPVLMFNVYMAWSRPCYQYAVNGLDDLYSTTILGGIMYFLFTTWLQFQLTVLK